MDKDGAQAKRGKYPHLLLQFLIRIIDTELFEGVLNNTRKQVNQMN